MNFYDRETDTIFRPLHAPSEGKCYYEESVFEQKSPSCDLSVIVPCYNGEKYLRPLLEQLAAQKTAYRCEVILVDDGSADGTLPLLQQFAENRTGWRVFSQKNGGTASARNAGIRVSRGKYLMFIDSDDSISEGYFEKLIRTAYENDAELAICAYESRIDNGVCVRRAVPENAQDRSVLNGCPWGKVFRRELFAHVLFPQGFWFEDTILAFLVYPRVQHFAATDACTYFYRTSSSNTTRQALKKPKSLDTVYITDLVLKEAKQLLPKDWWESAACRKLLLDQFYVNHRRLMGMPTACRKKLFAMQAAYYQSVMPVRKEKYASGYERALCRGSFQAGEWEVRMYKPRRLLALIHKKLGNG